MTIPMHIRRICVLFSLLFTGLAAPLVMAQQASTSPQRQVQATLSVLQVAKNAEGKEVLLPAGSAAPGQTLEYQTVYLNNGKTAIKSLEATLPLPDGITYVAGSAKPANPLASLDGKVFSAMPLKTMVKGADGKLQERLVPYSDYRALRWSLGELPGAEKAVVSARAQINAVSGTVATEKGTK